MSDHDARFRHPVTVRFRDVDAVGHAHHSQALVYFEEARWAFWRSVVGWSESAGVGYVLAEARVQWHQRVLWPQTVTVGVTPTDIGRKHFTLEYDVSGEDGERLVSGHTVQVMYDYEAGASIPVPPELRAVLERFAQTGMANPETTL